MMNKNVTLNTLGVVLVALLTQSSCGGTVPKSEEATAGGTVPKSPAATPGGGLASISQAASVPVSSPWTVAMETDKLTDEAVLTAGITESADGQPSHVYQLGVKCSPDSNLLTRLSHSITIATFTDQPPVPRRMPWRVSETVTFQYRVDHNAPSNGGLDQVFVNGGTWSSFADAGGGFSTLPATGLVVANLFPDETVDFPFAAMTADQRTNIEHACFPPAVVAARQKAAADEKAAQQKAASDAATLQQKADADYAAGAPARAAQATADAVIAQQKADAGVLAAQQKAAAAEQRADTERKMEEAERRRNAEALTLACKASDERIRAGIPGARYMNRPADCPPPK